MAKPGIAGRSKQKRSSPGESGLSHVDQSGRARMVNVGDKPVTERAAAAEGFVRISASLTEAIRANTVSKGNVLETARLAGVMGAKRTADLVPMCHPLPLDHVDVQVMLEHGTEVERVRITARVRTHGRTGVEMEALTAVSIAALTIVDMGKALDKGMVIEGVRVIEKRGGRSGDWKAPA